MVIATALFSGVTIGDSHTRFFTTKMPLPYRRFPTSTIGKVFKSTTLGFSQGMGGDVGQNTIFHATTSTTWISTGARLTWFTHAVGLTEKEHIEVGLRKALLTAHFVRAILQLRALHLNTFPSLICTPAL